MRGCVASGAKESTILEQNKFRFQQKYMVEKNLPSIRAAQTALEVSLTTSLQIAISKKQAKHCKLFIIWGVRRPVLELDQKRYGVLRCEVHQNS